MLSIFKFDNPKVKKANWVISFPEIKRNALLETAAETFWCVCFFFVGVSMETNHETPLQVRTTQSSEKKKKHTAVVFVLLFFEGMGLLQIYLRTNCKTCGDEQFLSSRKACVREN